MKLLLWNVEWNQAAWRRQAINAVLEAELPDVSCLTEATSDLFENRQHVLSASADYGYPHAGDRRKVWLTSSEAWQDVDLAEATELPPGRFVSGVTHGIRFVGVCIPWASAHVTTGGRNRKRWEDHVLYLHALRNILAEYRKDTHPICVLGDFNQRVPATNWNQDYIEHLLDALGPELSIDTAGVEDIDGKMLIDHVATSTNLRFEVAKTISRNHSSEKQLSDHPAIIGELKQ